ncbi:MAG: DUF2283 domain-containing protein [Patescibacteria group bacterium]
MRINYHSDTDSLYIHLKEEPSKETMVINNDINLDFGESGDLIGIDIYQNARKHVNITSLNIDFPIELNQVVKLAG